MNLFSLFQVFKELLVQAKIVYNLSPALRRRRQSMPPQNPSAGRASHSVIPSAAQLQRLQEIERKSLSGKRDSCVIA